MKAVVSVTAAELRGVPFRRYATVLHNLIGESQMYDDIDISIADRAEALVDGRTDTDEARDLLALAQEITRPACIDGYFDGHGDSRYWPAPGT